MKHYVTEQRFNRQGDVIEERVTAELDLDTIMALLPDYEHIRHATIHVDFVQTGWYGDRRYTPTKARAYLTVGAPR